MLGQRRIALVVDERHIELGAAEVGQARRRGKRQIAQFGVRIVDDVGCNFDRRFGGLTGGGGIAGERHEDADFDGIRGISGRGGAE